VITVSSQNEDESHFKRGSDVMEYFIHNMNTIETKTSEEQETKMSSTDT